MASMPNYSTGRAPIGVLGDDLLRRRLDQAVFSRLPAQAGDEPQRYLWRAMSGSAEGGVTVTFLIDPILQAACSRIGRW
jgi:hypothetical protein